MVCVREAVSRQRGQGSGSPAGTEQASTCAPIGTNQVALPPSITPHSTPPTPTHLCKGQALHVQVVGAALGA